MIAVDQTEFGYPKGNCIVAAMASIMEVGIDELPDLLERCHVFENGKDSSWKEGNDHWWNVLVEGARGHGWEPFYMEARANEIHPQGYAIAGGDSPRSDVVDENGKNVGHVVVCLDGEVVHDPHPSRDGLLGGIVKDWIMLCRPNA